MEFDAHEGFDLAHAIFVGVGVGVDVDWIADGVGADGACKKAFLSGAAAVDDGADGIGPDRIGLIGIAHDGIG